MSNQELAQYGERLAVQFLKDEKLKILDVNYSCKLGEVDIIAKDRGVIVFCEVKTRKNKNTIHPFDAITPRKLNTISKVGQTFLIKNNLIDVDYRIDAIAIYFANGDPRIKWIKNCTS
ncbi:YraN family protein [Proteinivorax hydrogeniformans]|uniref:UPF0102 protein PRVXH_001446 n=1 Tax=Proteinivorax hydrogeniformans TaxID=1826727 RepID=A0AAU8HPA3_9FIRM